MGIQRGLVSAGEREQVSIGSGWGQGMRGSISSCIRVIASFRGKDDVIVFLIISGKRKSALLTQNASGRIVLLRAYAFRIYPR